MLKKKREAVGHIIKKLSPLIKKPSTALPATVEVTIEQIEKWWDYWLLWRHSDRKIESFVTLIGWQGAIPKSMFDVFLELDTFYERMEAKRMEQEAKNNQVKNGR